MDKYGNSLIPPYAEMQLLRKSCFFCFTEITRVSTLNLLHLMQTGSTKS